MTSGIAGKLRDILSLWWVILACIPLIGFLGFLWAGIRAHNKKWRRLGLMYFLACTCLPLSSGLLAALEILPDASMILVFACVALFISWVHALSLVHPYLERVRALRELR